MASEKKTKNDRLVIRLESEMRASLRERAGRLGLDEAAYVRMLIYADVNGLTAGPSSREPEYLGEYARGQSIGAVNAAPSGFGGSNPSLAHHSDEHEVEEVEIPPDPDGDPDLETLMGAGPSLLDEIAALTAMPRPVVPAHHDRPINRSGPRFQSRGFNSRNWGQAAFQGPGSLTRAVGVGEGTMGNFMGDGRGNVTRDNFGHFGFVGTRSR